MFWSFLWFFLWIIRFWLLIIVFSDIFRSHDPPAGKGLLDILVIVLPYLGVFIYLIARAARCTSTPPSRRRPRMRSPVITSRAWPGPRPALRRRSPSR